MQGCDPVLNHSDYHKNRPQTDIKILSRVERNRLVCGNAEATTHLRRWTRSPVHVGQDSPHVLAKRTFLTRQTGSGHRGQDTGPGAPSGSQVLESITEKPSVLIFELQKIRRIFKSHPSNNSYNIYYILE